MAEVGDLVEVVEDLAEVVDLVEVVEDSEETLDETMTDEILVIVEAVDLVGKKEEIPDTEETLTTEERVEQKADLAARDNTHQRDPLTDVAGNLF